MTIKQLKEYLKDLPEVDESGEEYEVWIDGTGCKPGLTNECDWRSKLNKGDILLGIKPLEEKLRDIDSKIRKLENKRFQRIMDRFE